MSKQFRSFHEFIQPSDLDYEGWLEELPRGAVKNSDMPKGKELQISSLIGPSNLGSPEEDSDPSSESDMGPSQLKFKRRKYDRYNPTIGGILPRIHIQMKMKRVKWREGSTYSQSKSHIGFRIIRQEKELDFLEVKLML
ncbi:hypothetical protein M0R45_026681 [Rubus argutus]|uniref:Uncharacterized protein n=1 Tax=Rubus argutus TaxID=59490 RepID=A0AAW1WY41_RUBAR